MTFLQRVKECLEDDKYYQAYLIASLIPEISPFSRKRKMVIMRQVSNAAYKALENYLKADPKPGLKAKLFNWTPLPGDMISKFAQETMNPD